MSLYGLTMARVERLRQESEAESDSSMMLPMVRAITLKHRQLQVINEGMERARIDRQNKIRQNLGKAKRKILRELQDMAS